MAPFFTGLTRGIGGGGFGKRAGSSGSSSLLPIYATGVSIGTADNYMINVNSNGTGVLQYNTSTAFYTTDHGSTWSSWSLPAAINSNNGRNMASPAPNGNHWFLTDMDNNGGGRQIVHYASSVGGSWTKIYDVAVSRNDQCYNLAADNSGNAAGLTGNNGDTGRGFNINSSGTASYVGSYVSSGGPGRATWTGTSGEYIQVTQYRGLVSTTDSWSNYSTIETFNHPSGMFGRDDVTKNWIVHGTSGVGTNAKIYIRYNSSITDISSAIGVVVASGSYYNRYSVTTKNGLFYVQDRSDATSTGGSFKIYSGASASVISTSTTLVGYLRHITDSGRDLYIPTA